MECKLIKNGIGVVVALFLSTGCARTIYPKLSLRNDFPFNEPALELRFLSDSDGIVMGEGDTTIFQCFKFKVLKKRKNMTMSIFTYVDETLEFIPFCAGDTFCTGKKDAYFFKNNRLVYRFACPENIWEGEQSAYSGNGTRDLPSLPRRHRREAR